MTKQGKHEIRQILIGAGLRGNVIEDAASEIILAIVRDNMRKLAAESHRREIEASIETAKEDGR